MTIDVIASMSDRLCHSNLSKMLFHPYRKNAKNQNFKDPNTDQIICTCKSMRKMSEI